MIIIFTCLICLFNLFATAQDLTTHFNYTAEELERLKSTSPSQKILTPAALNKWDEVLYTLMQKPMPDGGTTRLATYLYVAQRDAAFVSYRTQNGFIGSLDPLSLKVIRLFAPDFQPQIPIESDDYSQLVSEIVFNKIQERFQEEEKDLKDYAPKIGPLYWKETPPVIGQKIGSCRPWLLEGGIQAFRAPEPPAFENIIWLYGLSQIRQAQAQLSPQQIELIYYWAGQSGPGSGNWLAIMNNYIKGLPSPLPLDALLRIRSIAAMGLADALIAAFDSKYTYWVVRPHMRDPSLKTVVPAPKHPSYPSAHSVSSSAVAVILSHYFPEHASEWTRLAIEAGNTRIWAGIHYVFDHEQGLIQGERVGKSILNRLQLPEQPVNLSRYSIH